jgi:hypothetical protein
LLSSHPIAYSNIHQLKKIPLSLLIPLHIQTRKSLKYYHFLPLLTLTNPTFLTLIISKHGVAKKEAKCTLKSDYPRMERNILILQQLVAMMIKEVAQQLQ